MLSFVALLGLLYIEFKARTECVETSLTVYLILGGTVMGLNGKEFADVLGIFKK